MPESLIMGAYFRRQGDENRATEMLATVIAGVSQYADQLADLVGLPRADSYIAETQVPVPGCVIDLEIQAINQGDMSWLLWSEHKVSAAFGEDQLPRYAHALKAKAGLQPSRLIAITLDPPTREIESQAAENDIRLLRWRDLVGPAEKAGHALAGSSWRAYPTDGASEVSRRLLLDWLIFCQNEGLDEETTLEPLTTLMIDILPKAAEAVNVVEGLLEAAFETASKEIGTGAPKDEEEDWRAPAPENTWLADYGAWLYAKYDTDDSWAATPTGKPVFAAGMFVVGKEADEIRENLELKQAFADDTFSVWSDGSDRHSEFDVSRVLPMTTVTAQSSAARQQAITAAFFTETFHKLLSYNVADGAL